LYRFGPTVKARKTLGWPKERLFYAQVFLSANTIIGFYGVYLAKRVQMGEIDINSNTFNLVLNLLKLKKQLI
jgi:hypothetical protein